MYCFRYSLLITARDVCAGAGLSLTWECASNLVQTFKIQLETDAISFANAGASAIKAAYERWQAAMGSFLSSLYPSLTTPSFWSSHLLLTGMESGSLVLYMIIDIRPTNAADNATYALSQHISAGDVFAALKSGLETGQINMTFPVKSVAATYPESASNDSGSGSTAGVAAGVSVSLIVLFGAVGFGIWWFYYRNRSSTADSQSTDATTNKA